VQAAGSHPRQVLSDLPVAPPCCRLDARAGGVCGATSGRGKRTVCGSQSSPVAHEARTAHGRRTRAQDWGAHAAQSGAQARGALIKAFVVYRPTANWASRVGTKWTRPTHFDRGPPDRLSSRPLSHGRSARAPNETGGGPSLQPESPSADYMRRLVAAPTRWWPTHEPGPVFRGRAGGLLKC